TSVSDDATLMPLLGTEARILAAKDFRDALVKADDKRFQLSASVLILVSDTSTDITWVCNASRNVAAGRLSEPDLSLAMANETIASSLASEVVQSSVVIPFKTASSCWRMTLNEDVGACSAMSDTKSGLMPRTKSSSIAVAMDSASWAAP